jgi:hypothetical protein
MGANQPAAYQPGGQFYGATQAGGYQSGGPFALADPLSQQYNQLQSLQQLYGPQEALSGALGQQQIDALTGQTMLGQASLNQSILGQRQEAMYGQEDIDLQNQALGIQQGALQRQLGLVPQQYGLQQQQFGLQEQGIQAGAAQQMSNLNQQLGASGAYVNPGSNTQRGYITSNEQRAMQGVGLERQQAALSNKEQMAQLQDSQKQLDLQAQRLGISSQELKSRLDNALAQLGLQGKINSMQLMGETAKIQQGEISPYSGLIGMIMQRTSLPIASGQGG